MYYVYMLRCMDKSLYTGITNDLDKRMKAHFSLRGAKYTKVKGAYKLEVIYRCKGKSLACRLEYYIKTLKKAEKEKIVSGEKLSNFLSGKVDCRRYYRIYKNM